MQDFVEYSAIAVLWIAVVLGNVIMKKIQPEDQKLYFFYSLFIAVSATVFCISLQIVDDLLTPE